MRCELGGLPADCVSNAGRWNGWAHPVFTREQVDRFVALVELHKLAGWDAESAGFYDEPNWTPYSLFVERADGMWESVGGLTWTAEGVNAGFVWCY